MTRFATIVAAAVFWTGTCMAQAVPSIEQLRKELDTDLASLRQKGEAVALDDLPKSPPLDDKDNAGVLLRQAAKVLNYDTPAYEEADQMEIGRPPTPEQALVLTQVATENEEALRLVASAVGKKVDWVAAYRPPREPGGPPPIVVKSPLVEMLLPHLSQQRLLANTLQFCALAAHATGDDATSLKHVRETLFLARATGEPPTVLVTHLVSVGIDALAADEVVRIAADMQPGQGDDVRQQCRQIIAELLTDAGVTESLIRALRFERMMQIDSATCFAEGKLADEDLTKWFAPAGSGKDLAAFPKGEARQRAALVDARILADYSTRVIAAISSDWPATKSKLPAVPDKSNDHPFVRLFLPSFDKTLFRQHYVGLAARRLAAVALAARLHSQDHKGELPPDLAALVPAYLSSIPMDPLATDSPLKYDRQRAIVQSIGADSPDFSRSARVLSLKLR